MLSKDRKNNGSKSNENQKKSNYKWVLIITLWTFILSTIVSVVSETILRNFEIVFAFITLILVIVFGVFFDIIGIAVTAADEKTFHSMGANKIREAKYAVKLVRNAGKVSNFCNDVIGDISGIISGAAGTIIVMKLVNEFSISEFTLVSVVMTGFIASLTVGGKAIGKELAINKSEKIIFITSKVIMLLDTKLRIDILPELRNNKK